MIPNCKKDLGGSSYEEISKTFNTTDAIGDPVIETQKVRKYTDGTLIINCKLSQNIIINMATAAGYRCGSLAFHDYIISFKSDLDQFDRPQVFWNIYNYDYTPSSDLIWISSYLPLLQGSSTNPGNVVIWRNSAVNEKAQVAIGYMAIGRWK